MMRFSEIFLRLGCSLVGWMVVTAYFLWLAVAGRIGCDGETGELLRLLLFAAPVATALAFLTRATQPMPEVHEMLRWIGIVQILLLPFALATVWDVAGVVYFGRESACATQTFEGPMQFWPVVQIVAVIVCLRIFARMWFGNDPADLD